MSEGIGIIIAVAIIAFLIWLIGKLISISLFLVLVVPIYIVSSIYTGIKFIAMSTFTAIDTLFHLGFDMPVLVVWMFWGLVIGAAIQGCREMKIYGRKGTGVLIAITPVLLLALVGAVKIKNTSRIDSKITTELAPSEAVVPSDASTPENMVLIPAGEFQMGSDSGESHESPVHTVYVDAFYMDQYEVTNAEYTDFLNTNGKQVSGGTAHSPPTEIYAERLAPVGSKQIVYLDGRYSVKPGYENRPVKGVTWDGAMAYATWVGKRLPTEAEWEKAARDGFVGMTYPWGNTIDDNRMGFRCVKSFSPARED